ncbi:MAG: outer membrane protein transport protein [Ignavibacteria bacterium]|nr:outer membrane protein transport protein [Ignavibacteria bacterium]
MINKNFVFTIVLTVAFFITVQSVYSTDGYRRHGFGSKYSSLGGSGVALSLSSLGSITNPAGLVFLDNNRVDVNISLFSPSRDYNVSGMPSGFPGTFGLTPGKITSETNQFVFPTIGVSYKVQDNMSVGLAIYGNGGMNTSYRTQTFHDPTSPLTGVNLEQLFAGATYSVEFVDNHSLGVTGLFAWQRFRAAGLGSFAGFSSSPNNLTENSNSTSTGFGAKFGYMGRLLPQLSIGGSFQTKMYMSEFERYSGLFAQQGGFDIPATWTAGFAATPTQGLTFSFDVTQILYSQIKSINNPMLPNLQNSQLGNDEGAGFGWKDMTVYKFGLMYEGVPGWSFRGGYSYGKQPIPDSEVMFNILAPGVIEQHITFGLSKVVCNNEFSIGFMYALNKEVSGANPMEAPGQQTIELSMNQWQIDFGYAFSGF